MSTINVSSLPKEPMTAYQAAAQLFGKKAGSDPNEVAAAMYAAGWTFFDNDWNGDDILKPPGHPSLPKKNISKRIR